MPWFLDASFDFGTASASPPQYTRSEDKEGPNTIGKGREGTRKKGKERTTLAGTKQSRESDIKEHAREHLKRENEKK